MSIQGALTDLMKVFLAFYIGCCAVGRPDIPFKVVSELRDKAVKGAGHTRTWGCPSITANSGDCQTFDPRRYR